MDGHPCHPEQIPAGGSVNPEPENQLPMYRHAEAQDPNIPRVSATRWSNIRSKTGSLAPLTETLRCDAEDQDPGREGTEDIFAETTNSETGAEKYRSQVFSTVPPGSGRVLGSRRSCEYCPEIWRQHAECDQLAQRVRDQSIDQGETGLEKHARECCREGNDPTADQRYQEKVGSVSPVDRSVDRKELGSRS